MRSRRPRANDEENRWVVPHNPYLSRRYNAHINVEYCYSVASVKYIHKYIHKGTDRVMFRLEDAAEQKIIDEPQEFLDITLSVPLSIYL